MENVRVSELVRMVDAGLVQRATAGERQGAVDALAELGERGFSFEDVRRMLANGGPS